MIRTYSFKHKIVKKFLFKKLLKPLETYLNKFQNLMRKSQTVLNRKCPQRKMHKEGGRLVNPCHVCHFNKYSFSQKLLFKIHMEYHYVSAWGGHYEKNVKPSRNTLANWWMKNDFALKLHGGIPPKRKILDSNNLFPVFSKLKKLRNFILYILRAWPLFC